MFRLLRFYSVTSCIIVVATAVALTLFYRQVTIYWVEGLAESGSLSLAQSLLNSVRPEFDAYLGGSRHGARRLEPPAVLSASVEKMTRNTSVESVKIYNRSGLTVFSTQKGEVGASAADAPGFLSAANGDVFSSLTIRDAFNRFKTATEKDNLMHTYIPVRSRPAEPVLAVLEIHTDITGLISESDRVLFIILAGTTGILALSYAALCLVVRHAKNIIEAQQKTIRERTESLEVLSEQLLESGEFRSKKIAIDLHEGLAQTLSAIKVNVERTAPRRKAANPQESIVPVLQNAIHEVRTIATELWPSSLEDLGLLPTLSWFCREFEGKHPQILIQREISLHEGTIPTPLKIVIYRIIESAFRNIAKHSNTDQIRFMLHLADGMIHLIIGDTPSVPPAVKAVGALDPTADPHVRFAEVKERTKLSRGAFSTTLEYSGGVTLHASWACGNQTSA